MGKLNPDAAKKARENGKKGGRPPGSLSPKTLDRIKVAERIRQRTLGVADILFESQLSLARGSEYLFRIDKEFIKTGADKKGNERGYWRNKKPVLVTNPEEMRQYLEDELCNGNAHDEFDESAAYYYLTARDPVNQAIDSMQDRGLGPVKHEVDITITPKPIYGGNSALPQPKQQKLPPKSVKATIIKPGKERIVEEQEA